MKTKTMFKSAIAVVAALAIATLGLVGCAPQSGTVEPEPTTGTLTFANIESGDALTEDSTEVIVHFTSEDQDFYHVVPNNDETATIEMFPGHYTVEVIAPLTADGYLMTAEGMNELDITAGETTEATVTLTKPEAAATANELDTYLATVTTASESGDDTFADGAVLNKATELVNKLKTQIAEAEAAAKAQAEAEAAAAAEAERAAAAASTSASGGSSYSGGGSSNGGGSGTSGGGSSAPASSGSDWKDHAGSGGSGTSKGTCPEGGNHNWVSTDVDGYQKECTKCGALRNVIG